MATIALEHPDHPGRSGRVRCQLVVVDGPDMGRAVTLGSEPVKVGSDRGCGLVLGDTGVSRQHLQITAAADGQFLIEDLGSKNGTLYEGAKVSALRVPAGATVREQVRRPARRHVTIEAIDRRQTTTEHDDIGVEQVHDRHERAREAIDVTIEGGERRGLARARQQLRCSAAVACQRGPRQERLDAATPTAVTGRSG